MPIPGKKVKIDLKSAVPTALTPEVLQKQLHDIGLTCQFTTPAQLEKFIQEVQATVPHGLVDTYKILKPAENRATALDGFEQPWTESSVGNWEPNATAIGYGPELEYIIYPEHFDWLKANRPSFTGSKDEESFKRKYDSVDAIKDAFVNLALTASSALVQGLDKDSITSIFSNVISPMNDQSAKDYNKTDSRVIFLVLDYDKDKHEASAIGVLSVEWHLVIKDYKEKKKAIQHDTTMDVTARAVLYSDLAAMEADLAAAKAHFKGRAFGGLGESALKAIPVKDTKVEIFDKQPPADKATFIKSLPLVATNERAQVIVLYSPDLQAIGSIDNTRSEATSTYSKSVTTGFTFSSTQTIDVGAEFEAGVIVAKGKVTVNFSLSFTEQYSKTTTETIDFSVPPKEIAYTYQGTLRCRVLEYDPKLDRYSYKAESRFLSPVMATTKEPIASSVTAVIVR